MIQSASTDWLTPWREGLVAEHRRLFDYETRQLRPEYAHLVDCPLCGADDAEELCEKDWFRYVQCRRCSMVYLNPRLTDAATHAFYNTAANATYNAAKFEEESSVIGVDESDNSENLALIDRYRGGKKGKLLEIGSAKGYFLERAKEAGYEVHGLELNEANWRLSRERLGDTVLNVDLSSAFFPAGTFDVIYMRDLIQHIPDPLSFLRECNRVAKPGCTVYIGTHNVESLIHRAVKGRYTTFFGFMEPNHFSPRTIRRILADAGFRVLDIQFKARDVTVGEIIGHFLAPTSTAIHFTPLSKVPRTVLRGLSYALSRRPLRILDQAITPRVAVALRRGSWMDVIAEKPE